MKNLFDKNKYRLSDAEKSAIWRDISQAQTGRRHWRLPRLQLTPAFATAAVTVCGLAIIFLVSRDDTQKFRRVESVVATPDIATEETVVGQALPQTVPQAPQSQKTELQPKTDVGQSSDAAREKLAPAEAVTVVREPVQVAVPEPAPTVAVDEVAKKTPHGDFDRPAIESVERALSQQSGIVMRGGEHYVRGGRSDEMVSSSMHVDEVAAKKGDSSNEPRPVRETPPARSGFDEEVGRDDRDEPDETD